MYKTKGQATSLECTLNLSCEFLRSNLHSTFLIVGGSRALSMLGISANLPVPASTMACLRPSDMKSTEERNCVSSSAGPHSYIHSYTRRLSTMLSAVSQTGGAALWMIVQFCYVCQSFDGPYNPISLPIDDIINAPPLKTPQQISLKFGLNIFHVRVILPQFWSESAVQFQRCGQNIRPTQEAA